MIKAPIPTVLSEHEHTLTLRLTLDPAFEVFKGHFPMQPLLPGVAQLLWAQEYAVTHFHLEHHRFAGIPKVKFTSPLVPGDEVELTLKFSQSPKTPGLINVDFAYVRIGAGSEKVPASQGRIAFQSREDAA